MPASPSLDDLTPARFYTLSVLAMASGIPASSIRAAFVRGEVLGMRTRPACNAPVRIKARDFCEWLERCSRHRRVVSPAEAADINRNVGDE